MQTRQRTVTSWRDGVKVLSRNDAIIVSHIKRNDSNYLGLIRQLNKKIRAQTLVNVGVLGLMCWNMIDISKLQARIDELELEFKEKQDRVIYKD